MKIFIKVEFFQNSKYLQHLLEHTIWGNLRKIDVFFDLFLESDLHTFNSYILWEIPNYCDLENFKQAIFSEPNLKIFNYEKKVLKDELLKTPFKLKIEQKIWKILFWKDFNITKNQKVSFEKALIYHKKYFNEKNIIITDDDYNILEDNLFEKKFGKNLDFKTKKFYFKINDFPCFLFVKKIENYLDYYLFFFLEFFYTNLFSYQIRFNEWFYYYDHEAYSYRIYDANIFCLTCEILDFEEEFFEKAKKSFLEIIEKWYWKKWKIVCKMVYWEEVDLEKVKSFFENFSSFDLKEIIWKQKDYKYFYNC